MIDTDITLLPIGIEMDLARLHAMILTAYLPSAPASPQTLDRVGCVAVPAAPQPSTRGLPVPESLQPVPWVG